MTHCLIDPTPLLRFDFGPHHPFKIYRLGLTHELMAAYGLTEGEGIHPLTPRQAEEAEGLWFHSSGYLEALRLADSGMWVPNLFAHGLGTPDNPAFPGVYEWGMLVAGASIDCAREILRDRAAGAFNFAGGLHHAMPSQASGFCHVNDAALAIHALLLGGKRVAYVDIDAHHGDGVQSAFYSTPDVLTISVHQTGYTIFPGTGFVEETGRDRGIGYAVNVPLLPGAGDDAYRRVFDEVIIPLLEAYRPDVLVTQLGADAIVGDAVANLRLTLREFEASVRRFRALGLPWLALGGGGYAVANVVRAWTLAWGVMIDADLPDEIPAGWMTRAAAYGVSASRLRGGEDRPPTPEHVHDDLSQTIERLRGTVFPVVASGSA